jgi:hypothetical protein
MNSAPIIVDFPDLDIPVSDVIKRMGYPTGQAVPNESVHQILDVEIQSARTLIKPKGVYRVVRILSTNGGKVIFEGLDFSIESVQVAKLLRKSERMVMFMTTLGSGLDDEIESLIASGHLTEGFVLDAIGSETADAAADQLHRRLLGQKARDLGYRVTPRFSPGYGDWPITVQPEMRKACGGEQIGIRVTESSLMLPRKSVSAVFGWEKI